jgi:hypothetical protein
VTYSCPKMSTYFSRRYQQTQGSKQSVQRATNLGYYAAASISYHPSECHVPPAGKSKASNPGVLLWDERVWEIAPRDSKGFLEAEHPRRRNQHTKSESVRLGALGESDATPASQGARTGRVVSELGAVSVPPRRDSTIARVKIQYVVHSISSMDAAQYLRRTPSQKAERASQLGGDPTLRVPGRGTGTGGGSNASGG